MICFRVRLTGIILVFSSVVTLAQYQATQKDSLLQSISDQDYTKGVLIADSLIRLNPDNPDLYYLSGLCYRNLMKFGPAADHFRLSDSLAPGNKRVLANLADSYYELARLDEAEKTARLMVSLDSLDPVGWIQLGKIYVRMSRPFTAIEIYNRLSLSDSLNLWYPRQIANLLLREERLQDAMGYLLFLAEADSSDIENYLRIGQTAMRMGARGLVPVMDKAVRQDSTEALLYRYRGGLQLAEGEFASAEEDLLKAISLGDTSVYAYRYLGMSQYSQSAYGRALQSLEKTVAKDSADAQSWYYLGFCYKWNLNIPKAIECLNKALKTAIPEFAGSVYSGLGQMYSLRRDTKQAMICYEKALEYNPSDPAPMAQIGLLIEESMGDREKAKEYYENFLKAYRGTDRNLVSYLKSRIQTINEKLFMEGKLKKE